MPTRLLVEPDKIDPSRVLLDRAKVETYLQHRYEMLQIDAVLDFNPVKGYAVGYRRVRPDEFWVRGHIPGRPVFPGVLLIECGAQMATIHIKLLREGLYDRFFAFSGVDRVKFRGQVLPGDEIFMVTRPIRLRSRSFVVEAQGIARGKVVFEGEIAGMEV